MKSRSIRIAGVTAVVLLTLQLWAQSPNNPLDIALLRWYPGDISALFTANLGPFPDELAFDGANMWIANEGTNTVTKLRASDGACVGTCVFTVGNDPCGMAFDGANMWVANAQDSTVTKLRASDGGVLGTFPVSGLGCGIAFDGAHIWVANSLSGTVTELQAASGSILGTFTASPASTPYVTALAFDGIYIWATNPAYNTLVPGYVTRLRASDGACVGVCTFQVGVGPNWEAFDGAYVWVSNSYDGTVTRLRASDGACLGSTCTFSVGGPTANAGGIAFDGTYMWVANQTPSTVTKLSSTGAIVGVFQLGPSTNTPFGVAFDGANIWVGYGQGSHLPAAGVYKL